jgi:hypothetical protein
MHTYRYRTESHPQWEEYKSLLDAGSRRAITKICKETISEEEPEIEKFIDGVWHAWHHVRNTWYVPPPLPSGPEPVYPSIRPEDSGLVNTEIRILTDILKTVGQDPSLKKRMAAASNIPEETYDKLTLQIFEKLMLQRRV